MLIDHIGYCTNSMPLRIVGRLAFPIFLYFIYNGYKHTSSRWRYALRLGVFALISQIPYSLFIYNSLWNTNGNVFFTLLMALLSIWVADVMSKHRVLKWFSLLPAIAVFFLYHYGILKSSYGARAIIMAMVFMLFDGKGVVGWILTTLGYMFALFYAPILSCALGVLRGRGFQFPAVSEWSLIQAFSALALPLIFAYNGKKGKLPFGDKGAKIVQYGFYLFYPVHQLVLWLIRIMF